MTAWLPRFNKYWAQVVVPQIVDPEIGAVLRKQLEWRLRQKKHPYVEDFISHIPWPTQAASPDGSASGAGSSTDISAAERTRDGDEEAPPMPSIR